MLLWYLIVSMFFILAAGLGWYYFQNRKLRQKQTKLQMALKAEQHQSLRSTAPADGNKSGSTQTTAKLRGYLKLLDTLINTIPNPLFFRDIDGIYRGCNEAFATQVMGISRDSIIGKRPQDLSDHISPELAAFLRQQEIKMRHQRGMATFEVVIPCATGQRKEFLVSMAAVKDDDGRLTGSIGVMQDLTQKNRAAREQMQKEKLQGVLETAGAVCHEMNQPLQVIYGLAELLKMELDTDGKALPILLKLNDQAELIATITSKLQNITHYESMEYVDGSTIVDIAKSSNTES